MPHLYTNGIATYFEDAALGGASGPAVVLIHGHSADLRMWDEQGPALRAAGYRVIRHAVRLPRGGGLRPQFALAAPERIIPLPLVDSTLPGFPYSDELSGRMEALV